jgi:hypothetical protein
MTFTTLLATIALTLSTAATSTPRITGITPQSIVTGPTAQQIAVTGQGFMRGLSMVVTDPAGATQVFKDINVETQESASFNVAVAFPIVGVYQCVVTNTDGGVSQPFGLTVRDAAPAAATSQSTAPVITSISPSTLRKQSQPQTLRVDGARFAQGLIVTFDDPTGKAVQYSGRDITNQTANSFTLTVIITVEGEYTLSLVNPGGEASNSVSLSVRGTAAAR